MPDPRFPDLDLEDTPAPGLVARARRWKTTHDPRALWPGLDPAALPAAADAIGAVVASRLGDRCATLGAADGRDAYTLGVAALLTGTGPLLGDWVDRRLLDVSDALAAILARHLAHGRARIERIARGVMPAVDSLLRSGVTPAVIKGFHTAHVYFSEPGLRPMADVDLVVRPEEVTQAEAALREAGFAPSHIVERPYKRDWFPPDDSARIWSFELFDARDRWKLELHDGANFGYLARFGFRLDGGARSGVPWSVDGHPLRVPEQPLRTIILATHLSTDLYTRRLLRLVELVLIIRRDRALGFFDWDSFSAQLDALNAHRFVYPALALVERLVPGTIDQRVLEKGRRASTTWARLVTERFTPTRPILEDRRVFAERMMWTATGRDALQWLAQWVNPLPGATWRERREIYHGRVRRLLSGRVSLRPEGEELDEKDTM